MLSLELARICTIPTRQALPKKSYGIEAYAATFQSCLPQGAPTSPMLSNLVMRDIDVQLAALAKESNMRFTRYADDIIFSCPDKRPRTTVAGTKAKILTILDKSGFRPNRRKTVIRGPGDRKVVLGMLVDGPRPRLPKDFKDALRLQLHFLSHPDFGPVKHAERMKCAVSTIYNRVLGLIHWARAVEPVYGAVVLSQFNAVEWPPISRRSYFDLDEGEK
ncbi:reverse transcriptase [compost metagenome]